MTLPSLAGSVPAVCGFVVPGGTGRAVPDGDVAESPPDLRCGIAGCVGVPAADVLGDTAGIRCGVRGVGIPARLAGPQLVKAGELTVADGPAACGGHLLPEGDVAPVVSVRAVLAAGALPLACTAAARTTPPATASTAPSLPDMRP